MTNQEILTKAIEKAIAGGWQPDDYIQIGIDLVKDESSHPGIRFSIKHIIFNHDFAKALWPKKELDGLGSIIDTPLEKIKRAKKYQWTHLEECLEFAMVERWQWHLILMVIADDPIKYLGEHL